MGPGRPCNSNGTFLPPGALPEPQEPPDPEDWMSFENRVEFEFADFAFRDAQLSAGKINNLMDLWAAAALETGGEPPFADKDELYTAIDAIPLGGATWKALVVKYTGPLPQQGDVPSWMTDEHELFYRDPLEVIKQQLSNPAFDGHIDYAPYKEFDSEGNRQWSDLMSGDWAWQQAVCFSSHFAIMCLLIGLS